MGVIAAAATGRALASLLFNVTSFDVVSFVSRHARPLHRLGRRVRCSPRGGRRVWTRAPRCELSRPAQAGPHVLSGSCGVGQVVRGVRR